MSSAKRKRFDPANYNSGPGQIFDHNTYFGIIRFIVFNCIAMYAGWHLDEMGRWLWNQFGNELVVSPAKEWWHRMVVVTLCAGGIFVALLQMYRVYIYRRNKAKEDEIEKLRKFHDSSN